MIENIQGQMTIFDFATSPEDTFKKAFDIFHESCKHRGWHKPETETEPSCWMCGCANGHLAQGWSDWIPCTVENCYLRRKS